MTAITRVFVAAPSQIARAGLSAMLDAAEGPEMEVVGEAGSLSERDPRLGEADVVVLGADEGLLEEAAPALFGDGPRAVVLLADDGHYVTRLGDLPLEGWGVVPADSAPEELSAAVFAVAQGLVVVPRSLAERLPLETVPGTGDLPDFLTPREREVLDLLGRGLPNKRIARELGISEHTVKFHISSLYAKLGVSSRAEAVGLAARTGLITL